MPQATQSCTLSPASLTFASVVVGATSAAKLVTLTNGGSTTLDITSIATSGDFSYAPATSPAAAHWLREKIAKSRSPSLRPRLEPNGNLTITDNAPNSPQTVALSGTGTVQVTLTPASKAFPATKVGTTSAAKVFTLSNKQSAALTGISIVNDGRLQRLRHDLRVKSGCQVKLHDQRGIHTNADRHHNLGTLQVSDSALGGPQTSSLTGTGK